jgi:hypothetical protein
LNGPRISPTSTIAPLRKISHSALVPARQQQVIVKWIAAVTRLGCFEPSRE